MESQNRGEVNMGWPWWRKEEAIETRQIYLPEMKIIIDQEALNRLKSYVTAVSTEITGLGIVNRDGNNFHIPEIFLLEQDASAASATLDSVAVSKLITKLHREGKDPSKLKFWWHSHVNMNPFWSGTDDGTCERFHNEQDPAKLQYFISVVMNKSFEYLCRFDIYQPLRMTIDRIMLQVGGEHVVPEDVSEEVEKKVHTTKFENEKRPCYICQGENPDCWFCHGKGVKDDWGKTGWGW